MGLNDQYIPGLDEEAKEVRVKVADIEKLNVSEKSTPTEGQNKKLPNVAEMVVIAFEEELKEAQDAQKQSMDATEQLNKQATNAAAQLAEPLLCFSKVEENAKVATEKLAHKEGQRLDRVNRQKTQYRD